MLERVEPNRNLTRWEEIENAPIAPVDVFKILNKWNENGNFDDKHIAAIARDLARSLSDMIETPEGGEIVYHPYSHSYSDFDAIRKMYGTRLVSCDEMRDGAGYLKQYRVILRTDHD